jgi:flagellar biosynthesis protein FliR
MSIMAGLKKAISDKTLSNFKDYHLPIMVLMFLVGIPVAWFGHLDMAFVAFTGTIIGGITGHSFSPAQKDKQDPQDSPDTR